jgi:membrane protein implicated in regulation of membrane protease activity
MTTVLWYIGAVGFLIAAVATVFSDQWALAAAFFAVSAALFVLAVRAQRKGSART